MGAALVARFYFFVVAEVHATLTLCPPFLQRWFRDDESSRMPSRRHRVLVRDT